MIETKRQFDLEERTFVFAKDVRRFAKTCKMVFSNVEDLKQLLRSSGSVGANYIEANEALSKKDFIHRIKICRKEAKESRYWLKLIRESIYDARIQQECDMLSREAFAFVKIFNTIVINSK